MLQAVKASLQKQLADEVKHHGQSIRQLEWVEADI